jgi:hypothetical protein
MGNNTVELFSMKTGAIGGIFLFLSISLPCLAENESTEFQSKKVETSERTNIEKAVIKVKKSGIKRHSVQNVRTGFRPKVVVRGAKAPKGEDKGSKKEAVPYSQAELKKFVKGDGKTLHGHDMINEEQ